MCTLCCVIKRSQLVNCNNTILLTVLVVQQNITVTPKFPPNSGFKRTLKFSQGIACKVHVWDTLATVSNGLLPPYFKTYWKEEIIPDTFSWLMLSDYSRYTICFCSFFCFSFVLSSLINVNVKKKNSLWRKKLFVVFPAFIETKSTVSPNGKESAKLFSFKSQNH